MANYGLHFQVLEDFLMRIEDIDQNSNNKIIKNNSCRFDDWLQTKHKYA